MKRLLTAVIVGLLLTACSKPARAPVSPEPAQTAAPAAGSEAAAPAAPVPEYHPGEKHQQALLRIAAEEYMTAEWLLKQVVAAEPRAAEAWNDLSLVQAELGRFREAAASARKALEIRPGFTFAEYNLGLALLQTSDGWRNAKPHLEASAKAQPDRPEPLYALGLWYKYAGDLARAEATFQQAAQMNYGPAAGALVLLEEDVAQSVNVGQVVSRFPDAPVQVIWDLMRGYIQSGYTRRIEQILPVRLRPTGETAWAALLREESSTDKRTALQFQVPTPLHDYMGACEIPGYGPVEMQVIDHPAGQQVLVTTAGRSLVCGRKGRFVEELFAATAPVTILEDGLMAGGTLYRYLPETSQYLPGPNAAKQEGLLAAIRKTGYEVRTDSGVWAAVDLKQAGGAGLAFAWEGGVAFQPDGGPVTVYAFDQGTGTYGLMAPYPHRVGTVTIPGQVFLAVSTLQPGGPNGADVLVLRYDPAGKRLTPIFRASSDGAGFDSDSVYTSFKGYRPQGGFDVYTTVYTWDETKGTFVPGKAQKDGK